MNLTSMKKTNLVLPLIISLTAYERAYPQQNSKPDILDKANHTVIKASNIIAVFQLYLLKARQLYYDCAQLAGDVKSALKNVLGGSTNYPNAVSYTNAASSANSSNNQGSHLSNDSSYTKNCGAYSSSQNMSNNSYQYNQNTSGNNYDNQQA
jgi:hypothetical protein